jgi:hypothetical protein
MTAWAAGARTSNLGPNALSVNTNADSISPRASEAAKRHAAQLDFDRVLGLSLDAPAEAEITELPEGAAALRNGQEATVRR